MKYTFKTVPTNYIVWQIGLIPNFGHSLLDRLCLIFKDFFLKFFYLVIFLYNIAFLLFYIL